MRSKERELKDLISIGPAMLRDFELLGFAALGNWRSRIREALREAGADCEAASGYCVLDTFEAAVAQAKNPRLPVEKCQWWWWSERRKQIQRRRQRN